MNGNWMTALLWALAALCLLAIALLWPGAANAQQNKCGPAKVITASIVAYGEVPFADATMPFSDGKSFPAQLFVNLAKGSWTLVFAPSADILCISAVGTEFRASSIRPKETAL